MSDVTAVIVFHGEKLLAPASIASFTRCCDVAAAGGVKVMRIALLDRPDPVTRDAILAAGRAFDHVEMLDHGDPGATRNAGVALSTTTYATFFDGDDLWGEEWIVRAHRLAEESADHDAVYHPRVVLRFFAEDHRIQSQTAVPPAGAKSHFYIQQDSHSPDFDPRAMVFCNVWSANGFALRSVYGRFPYATVDKGSGFGVEDWIWNLETLVSGVRHVVVPDTVHCVRIKPEGSLGRQHVTDGLVPPIHEYASRLEDAYHARAGAPGTAQHISVTE